MTCASDSNSTAAAGCDVLIGGDRVPAKDNVTCRLTQEDGEENVAVVVHAKEHAAASISARFCVHMKPTDTRKAAVNCEPYKTPRITCCIHVMLELMSQSAGRNREDAGFNTHEEPAAEDALWSEVQAALSALADKRAANTRRRSYSRPIRLAPSIAIQRKNTPSTLPANMPLKVICHVGERKQASIVYEFQSMETVGRIESAPERAS